MSPTATTVAAAENLYISIRLHILDLARRIEAPVRIREEVLANKFGVSRTPVREALVRLGQDGILKLEPRRGALLMPLTRDDYIEWLKLRVELEGFAAREAALNASQHDVDALRAILAPFHKDTLDENIDQYSIANVDFHAALLRLAKNRLLERMWSSFGHRDLLRTRTIKRLGRAHQSLDEHLAMINAIQIRDAQLAEQLARAHVQGLLDQTLANQ